MRSREQISRERRNAARKFQRGLFAKIRASQSRFWPVISGIVFGLKVDKDGRFDTSVANVKRSSLIFRAHQRFVRNELVAIGTYIGNRVSEFFKLNNLYFRNFKGNSLEFERADAKARRQILAGLGYNNTTGKLIRDGYLAKLISDDQVARDIFKRIDAAIKAKTPLEQFRRRLRGDFLSEDGLGMIESQFFRTTFDIFQQNDREIGQIYADELKLNFAIYSGTIKNNTRDFCRSRVNKVYDRETIDSWNNLQWTGKIDGADVKTALGGYNCRHSLDWISDEVAERLIRTRGLNKLN